MAERYKSVVVLAGGDLAGVTPTMVPYGSYVIAADSGARHAAALELAVNDIVGDLDSIDPALLEQLDRSGTTVHRWPVAKDETDFELALRLAKSKAPIITVIGGTGGRLDHELGVLAALCSRELADFHVGMISASETLFVVHGEAFFTGAPGDLLSLIPWGGPATGITTTGLEYQLVDDTLQPTQARGVSNVFAAPEVTVAVKSGTLLAVRPERS